MHLLAMLIVCLVFLLWLQARIDQKFRNKTRLTQSIKSNTSHIRKSTQISKLQGQVNLKATKSKMQTASTKTTTPKLKH